MTQIESATLDHPLNGARNGGWMRRAACRGADMGLFFSHDEETGRERAQREAAAKRVCEACPVVEQCRSYAVRHELRFGVWGGLSEGERAKIARARKLIGGRT